MRGLRERTMERIKEEIAGRLAAFVRRRFDVEIDPVDSIPGFDVEVPGDISSAAFFLVAAALSGRELLVRDCGLNPTRTGLLDVLRRMGARIETRHERAALGEAVRSIRLVPGPLAATGVGAEEVDPATVDWTSLSSTNFPFRLRQDPGPWNALGEIKFMFPNPHDVYLHGTPDRHLFARSQRSFSSGCIRIEKPVELAVQLLGDDPRWSREAILTAIDRRVEQTVRLPEPVPVHLLYWTAFAGADGVEQPGQGRL